MTPPLEGIRVVDFGQFIAAPAAGGALAALGADVIKVEPPDGEAARHIGAYGQAMVRTYNGGKRSAALDLTTEAGRSVAARLVAGADVVLQNARPGAMEARGLGAADLRARHPELITGCVTGFGRRGPSARRPGFDIAAQAESGIMWVTGEADGEPQRVGFPVVDAAAGHVLAEAVLAALVGRLRFGGGREVEVSLLEVAMHLQGTTWGEYFAGGVAPTRKGNGQPSVAPAADVVATRDGSIVVSAYTAAHFTKLCRLLDRPDLDQDPRFATNAERVAHRPALLAELSRALGGMTSREALDLLVGHGLVAAGIDSYERVLTNPDVIASGIVVDVPTSVGGSYRTLRQPWTIDEGADPRPAPDVGEHTAEVMTELGYGAGQIATLVGSGAVHTA